MGVLAPPRVVKHNAIEQVRLYHDPNFVVFKRVQSNTAMHLWEDLTFASKIRIMRFTLPAWKERGFNVDYISIRPEAYSNGNL